MAKKKTKNNSAKRYGPRYGKKIKQKVSAAEAGYKGKNKCPYCKKIGVKRLSVGIYTCTKCDAKFTAKAYGIDVK